MIIFYAYIDDAHGMSIMGKHGRGFVLGSFDKQPEKMVVAVSFSKSFGMGCGGAVILPNSEWQRKIKRSGPTFIFSAPMPVPMFGSGIAAAKIHLSSEIKQLQEKLRLLISLFQALAKQYKLPVINYDYSHIHYIKLNSINEVMMLALKLKKNKIFVGSYIYPAVSKNNCGIRIVLSLHHTEEDIKHLVEGLHRYLPSR